MNFPMHLWENRKLVPVYSFLDPETTFQFVIWLKTTRKFMICCFFAIHQKFKTPLLYSDFVISTYLDLLSLIRNFNSPFTRFIRFKSSTISTISTFQWTIQRSSGRAIRRYQYVLTTWSTFNQHSNIKTTNTLLITNL